MCANKIDVAHRERQPFRMVETVAVIDSFNNVAESRKDKWGDEVFIRLQVLSVGDLFAAEARYHVACSNNFRYIKKQR